MRLPSIFAVCALGLILISNLPAEAPATPMVKAKLVTSLAEAEGYWRSVSIEGGKESERPQLVTFNINAEGKSELRTVGAEETLTVKGTLSFAGGKGNFRWEGEAEGAPAYLWLDAHGRLIAYDKFTKAYVTLERAGAGRSE